MSWPMKNAENPCALSIFNLKLTRIGGVERSIRELAVQLSHYGWRSVLCFPSAPSGTLADLLSVPGAVVEAVPGLFGRSLPGVCSSFVRVARRYHPAIVHLHFMGYLSPFPWLSKLCGAERIYFADHRSRPEGFRMKRFPPARRLLCRAVNGPLTGIISASNYGTRCQAAFQGLPAERLLTIYNGVDLDRVAACEGRGQLFRRRRGISLNRLLVAQVSWMIPEKGISDFIRAARIIADADPRVDFALVGEGHSLDVFRREAAEAGLGGRVYFTGLIEDPLEEGVFEAADIVCQLSVWEEAFGHVILEAMAFGRPVVATSVGGIPELVKDGENGFLVSRRDAAAVADRVLRLAADPQLRAFFGERGRLRARADFSLARNLSAHLRLYGIECGQADAAASSR